MSPSHVDTPPLSRPGVLVAADDPALRNLLECGLNLHGFMVWTAKNGSSALDLFRHQDIAVHLALLSVELPGLDGPETLLALRALRPNLPCCFMIGGNWKYTGQDLLEMGATQLVCKPFSLAVLAGVLLQLVDYPDRRGEVRIGVFQTQITFGGQRAWLRNRSHSGLGLWLPEPIVVGSVLDLDLDTGLGTALPCLIEVRRCQSDGNGWAIGCRFAS